MRLEAFNSINIVPCGQGQGEVKSLKQEPQTRRAQHEIFGRLPSKCNVNGIVWQLLYPNKDCDTNTCRRLQGIHIKYQLSISDIDT